MGVCNGWNEDTTGQWRNITAISAGRTFTLGLCQDGTVVSSGSDQYDYSRMDVSAWRDIVAISAGLDHSIGMKQDGTLVSTGSNGLKQCDITNYSEF